MLITHSEYAVSTCRWIRHIEFVPLSSFVAWLLPTVRSRQEKKLNINPDGHKQDICLKYA